MTDHWHYASDIHGGAEEHHRHYDLEREDGSLRQEIDNLRQSVTELSSELAAAFTRISELEDTVREHQMAVPHAEVAS